MFKTLIVLYARSFWITASRNCEQAKSWSLIRALAGVHDAEHICHGRRKRSCTSGGSSSRPGFAPCPYSTARLEANQLQQVPWLRSAACAAGQDYAA